jgi:hypothetical protein
LFVHDDQNYQREKKCKFLDNKKLDKNTNEQQQQQQVRFDSVFRAIDAHFI